MAEPITPEQLHQSHRWFQLDELATLPGNPNQGDEPSLRSSVDEFGWIDGIVVHSGVIIAGNHRVEQAQAKGEAGLPGYDLTQVIPDIDDARRMAMAIAHNHTGRMGVNDPELLADAMVGLAGVDPTLAAVAGLHHIDADTAQLIDLDTMTRVAPGFQPSTEPQGRLDQKTDTGVCPHCGERLDS